MTAGQAGWLGVAAVVVIADGVAVLTHTPTMSDEFARRIGWGVVLLAGTAAHLLCHRRLRSVQ